MLINQLNKYPEIVRFIEPKPKSKTYSVKDAFSDLRVKINEHYADLT
jgi:hypothetical protein